jgi:hypothetical protein
MVNDMPTKIKEYMVVRTPDGTANLEFLVQKYIDLGWEPQGGVTAIYNSRLDFTVLMQAMIKRSE